jgi:hypothetical protein
MIVSASNGLKEMITLLLDIQVLIIGHYDQKAKLPPKGWIGVRGLGQFLLAAQLDAGVALQLQNLTVSVTTK